MGGAYTKNVVDLVVDSVAEVHNTNWQQCNTNSVQTTSIDVGAGSHVSNNTFENDNLQTCTLNLDITQHSDVQQQLAANIEQKAKSLVSGINLGQFTHADNYTNLSMNAAIDISSAIKQTCAANNTQTITVKVEQGATLTGNTFRNQAKALVKCIEKAATTSTAVQTLSAKVKQAAVAESKGFSIWSLIILLVVVAAVLVGGPLVAVESLVGTAIGFIIHLFPIIVIVVGGVLIGVHFAQAKTAMTALMS